jgi:hypothetical protein
MTFSLENKVVARYRDGSMIKGITYDFAPLKKIFHIVSNSTGEKVTHTIIPTDLKALFFLKSLDGNKYATISHNVPGEDATTSGVKKLKITFFDDEVLLCTSHVYVPGKEAFFVNPLEMDSNNIRIYINGVAIKQVDILS